MDRPLRDENSTNVRPTIAAFLGVWALSVVGGASAGVFTSLSMEEVGALAAFAALFAAASYFLDAEVHAWFLALDARVVRRSAWISEALVVAGIVGVIRDAGALGSVAGSVWLLFVLPLALALHAALVDRALRSRPVSSPRGKAPGVRRAAF